MRDRRGEQRLAAETAGLEAGGAGGSAVQRRERAVDERHGLLYG